MIFRLRSGSTTRARASRNTSEASSETRGRLSRSANRVRTCSASSSRRRPLSTKMQVRRSPIARWTSSAATVESTPPLTPHTTRPSGPTCSRIRAVASSTNDAIVQSPAHTADVAREVPQERGTVRRVHDLGMEQDAVQATFGIGHDRDRRVRTRAEDGESGRRRRPPGRRGSPTPAACPAGRAAGGSPPGSSPSHGRTPVPAQRTRRRRAPRPWTACRSRCRASARRTRTAPGRSAARRARTGSRGRPRE